MGKEALDLRGEYLGEGKERVVYVYALDPNYVIKFPKRSVSYNLAEYRNYLFLKKKGFEHWVAPCLKIGDAGQYLIMRRTKPTLVFPEIIPAFFLDVKRHNWSELNGKIVCHDYQKIRREHLYKERRVEWKLPVS